MSKPGVLIIVENLTVPLDRRVWQEATTLRDAGYTVSIVCPRGGRYTAAYELLDGIHVFRHPLPLEADGVVGYVIEYSSALFWEFLLAWRAYFKVGFDAIQACNPPDTIFLVAGMFKALLGTPFVFDHHDINPELYEAKFGRRGFFHRLLIGLERLTFRTANVSIATNETFKEIAVRRGGMDPDKVFIVRSIPDVSRFKRLEPRTDIKNGRRHLVGYVGIMGAQDGVDLLIDAMHQIVNVGGRRDVQCVIVGSGTAVEGLKAQVARLGLDDYVTFTGFMSGEPLLRALSTFDIGVIPDPKNVYNDKISMNKHFEYMTLGIPFVSFDLVEGRKISGDAALYASDNSPVSLADRMSTLLDDEDLRSHLVGLGRDRAKALLRWETERAQLLAAYETALGGRSSTEAATREAATRA
ncbi:MAG: glycosyltransferase family 4 protein [Hyphomicrobiaceae bacterium]|nr:glycosyltransferase family 4 protein [Hyphomicrobiaceae bacterium]